MTDSKDGAGNPQSAFRIPQSIKRPHRRLTLRRVLCCFLIALILVSFNISPLWRLMWYWPILSRVNFTRIKTPDGRRVEAWRWVEGPCLLGVTSFRYGCGSTWTAC